MSTLAPARRILVVEHDLQLSEILESFLCEAGYETDAAPTLEEALSKIDGQLYDFVLTDLLAPAPLSRRNTAYLSTVQQLRQHCHPIPVGILTGWRVDIEAAMRAGFAFIFEKPYDINVVLQSIADRLNAPFTPEQQQMS